MSIKSWPESEQPREKLLAIGVQHLSDAELLAVLLGTGHKSQSALSLARQLLTQFGSIAGVLSASAHKLGTIKGVGLAKTARLKASKEIGLRYDIKEIQGKEALTSSALTKRFLSKKLQQSDVEVFCGIFLDAQHQILAFKELFHGTIDGAAVYPREVAKYCLEQRAAAVIFAHNHPSGVAEPSQADVAITAKLVAALSAIDVRVLDHLIVGGSEVVSLSERALM